MAINCWVSIRDNVLVWANPINYILSQPLRVADINEPEEQSSYGLDETEFPFHNRSVISSSARGSALRICARFKEESCQHQVQLKA